jgi:hypothetical protein
VLPPFDDEIDELVLTLQSGRMDPSTAVGNVLIEPDSELVLTPVLGPTLATSTPWTSRVVLTLWLELFEPLHSPLTQDMDP